MANDPLEDLWHGWHAPASFLELVADEGISTPLELAACFEDIADLIELLPPLSSRDREAVEALHDRALGARRTTSGIGALGTDPRQGFLATARNSLGDGLRSWACLPSLGPELMRCTSTQGSTARAAGVGAGLPRAEVPCSSPPPGSTGASVEAGRFRGVKRDVAGVVRRVPSVGVALEVDPQAAPCAPSSETASSRAASGSVFGDSASSVGSLAIGEAPLARPRGSAAGKMAPVNTAGTFELRLKVPQFSLTTALPSRPTLSCAPINPVTPFKGRWHHRSSKEKWLTAASACPRYMPASDETAGLEKACGELYALYCEVGRHGKLWSDSTQGKDIHRMIFTKSFEGMSAQCIHGAMCTAKRFRRWLSNKHAESESAWHSPDPQAFGAWLLEVGRGGPTAAPSAWAHCDFLRSKVGIPFPTRADFVYGFRLAPTGHASTPAPTLMPWTLPRLIFWNMQQSGATRAAGQLVALVIVGCVRWKHARRSKLIEITPDTLTFKCKLGKSKVRGARRPFEWAVPRYLAAGIDCFDAVETLYNNLKDITGEYPEFVVPRLLNGGGAPEPFDEFDATPMSDAAFMDMVKGVFSEVGMNEADVKRLQYNSIRRYLPSAGEALRYDTAEAQSISNWTEIPKGVLSRRDRATHPTSRAYAATKEETALINKHKAVAAMQLYAEAKGSPCIRRMSWRCVHRARLDVDAAEAAVCGGWPWASLDLLSGPATPLLGDVFDGEGTASTIECAPSLEEVDTFSDVQLPELIRFGTSHKVHLLPDSGGGRALPFCRDKPFQGHPHTVEYPVSVGYKPCDACLRLCPRRVGQAVRAYAAA